MEFCEKLQELRKSRGLTQEELAEALFVSRAAISKWESARGYPSIDSLKDISSYFSVSIDDLLSAEKLIYIAEKENRLNICRICNMLFGITDLLSFLLVVLPLYPQRIEGFIYSVNLLHYAEGAAWSRGICWVVFAAQVLLGALKLFFTQCKIQRHQKAVTLCSFVLGIAAVLFLTLTRQAYAASLAFLLLVIKGALLFWHTKVGG